MRTLVILIVLILISSKNIYSQQEIEAGIFSPISEMYSNNYLTGSNSGMGNTGIASENGIGSSSLNPASFVQKNKFDLNIQYTVKTIQPWSEPYLYSSEMEMRQNWFFSGSIGFGYKVNKNIQVGLVYSNPTSYLFYYGMTEITNLYGPSDSIDTYTRIHLHQFSLPVSYSIGKVNLGLNISYGIYISDYHGIISTIQNPDGYEGNAVDRVNRFIVQAGAIYKPSEFLHLGATITSGGKNTVHTDDAFSFPSPGSHILVSKFPWRAGIGFEYKFPFSNIKICGDFKYENTSTEIGLNDNFNLNLGAEFVLNKKFTLRTGFFTLMDNRTASDNPITYVPVTNHTQYFLTLGGTINFKNADLTASLLDSHMSPGTIKNTYLNTSFSYHF